MISEEACTMAEPWNRVNIPFPCAVSSVRIHYTATTNLCVKSVLVESQKVLKLVHWDILQTEVRVLYELLYVLNNSCRGHKTFRALKQVERCINRLKDMELAVALQDLADLCPSGIQSVVNVKVSEAVVPSQPMLEWVCLKVLGAAQLIMCTMNHCRRAFLLSKQHLKWEFFVLNMVISSMLSRLWVVFRGVLLSLSTLYPEILNLRAVVVQARPMPYLTTFSLPSDLVHFLGPGGSVLSKLIHQNLQNKTPENKKKKMRLKKEKNHRETQKVPEDLGVAVDRGVIKDFHMKPFLNLFRNFAEGKSISHHTEEKQRFKKQMRGASSFTQTRIHLDKMIQWCKSQRMEREKRRLTFLRLKCQKMKRLEADGYNVHRKLQTFRQEVHSALSPQKSKTCASVPSKRRNVRLRSRLQTLRGEMQRVRGGRRRWRKGRKCSAPGSSEVDGRMRMRNQTVDQSRRCDHHDDDIDDIFASAGL